MELKFTTSDYYGNLIKERSKLADRIKEIDEEIQAKENEIIKGKFDKAIRLLKECADYLYDGDFEIRCPECGEAISLDYEDVVDNLETWGKESDL